MEISQLHNPYFVAIAALVLAKAVSAFAAIPHFIFKNWDLCITASEWETIAARTRGPIAFKVAIEILALCVAVAVGSVIAQGLIAVYVIFQVATIHKLMREYPAA